MEHAAYEKLLAVLNQSGKPLNMNQPDYNSLLERIGDSRFVLIGEATHGTREFYAIRAELTQRLIKQKDFMAVAIEGDWPDAYRINRFVQGGYETCHGALAGFTRFPAWMWCNKTVASFLTWLRQYNSTRIHPLVKVGFYGLDLYSLNTSMQAVINYLVEADPEAADQAKKRYSCFDSLADPQLYGQLTALGLKKYCVHEVIDQLVELQHHEFDYVDKDSFASQENYFCAMQNARLVKNAELYYRSMFEGHVGSWNVRDHHMMETLTTLATHLETRFDKPAKIIVWAHNSHIGDARATEMAEKGEINLGQLVREQYGEISYSIGFSTYEGTVVAASDWGKAAHVKTVQPALPSSYEAIFHDLQQKDFILHLTKNSNNEVKHLLSLPRLQRAIGVIYHSEAERSSHYYFTRLPYQFDSIIHIDKTSAIEPLELHNHNMLEELPETYPQGI